MTRTEIARFIKKESNNKELSYIKRATVEEIAKSLDITDRELEGFTESYLRDCGYTISKGEREAIMRAINKAYEINKKHPTYEYMDGDKVILKSSTPYNYIAYKEFENRRRLYYRGDNQRKAERTGAKVITTRIEKIDKRFEGFKGYNL